MEKVKKYIKFDNHELYLRTIKGNEITERCLGKINTHEGALTRAQKLQAVQALGAWVELC